MTLRRQLRWRAARSIEHVLTLRRLVYGTYIGHDRVLINSKVGRLVVSASDLSHTPDLLATGIYDAGLVAYIRRLAPGSTFVDVGANIGIMTIAAAHAVGPSGRVIAIEADPHNFGLLSENVALNVVSDRVDLHRAAAWSARGVLTLHSFSRFQGVNSVVPPSPGLLAAKALGTAPAQIEVPAIVLDDLLTDLSVDLMKVDVEGAEANVFEGAKAAISSGRVKRISFEVNPSLAGPEWSSFVAILRDWAAQGVPFSLFDGRRLTLDDVTGGRRFSNVVAAFT